MAVGGAEERKVNPKQRDLALAAASAAARRLLVRVIDLRFDLEDAAETIRADHGLTPDDLRLLRSDADALRREIELLADALWPSGDGAGMPGEEGETTPRSLRR
jgi:hypothetical protein